MRIKIDELTGAALNWAVAKCEGVEFTYENFPRHELLVYQYTNDWSLGGPIIEREGIAIDCIRCDGKIDGWIAAVQHEDKKFDGLMRSEGQGTTPLIAAMRCYVASKLCDNFTNEIDVLDEPLK